MLTRQQPSGSRHVALAPPMGDCPQHIVDELEAVVTEIQDFLQDFCDRFEKLTAQASTSPDNATDKGDSDESSGEWENKRKQAEQRIGEQVDLLTNAWLRLEDEQRALLQAKQGMANELKARATTFDGGSASRLQCLPGSSQFTANIEHSAVHEFERLRHEIQSSRPNIKSQ